jgi:ABC-type cobalamin/Fe3+-siderophores transport system ATPase subunit
MAMISCSNISLGYEARDVITGFSAEFAVGTITAILGANGCGKSTLLAALAGDLAPNSGEILLGARALGTYSAKELSGVRSLAVQSHHYWMAYTTAEILRLGHDAVQQERYDYVVEKLGLSGFLDQSVTTLSGGQLQRIEIARALLAENALVLLDEPFASQDVASTAAIIELLMAERAQGRTIILVAHMRREELSWCDQIIEIAG